MRFLRRLVLFFLLCGVPFWIVEDGGFVALRGSDAGVIYRSETRVSSLPEEDAAAIRDKIPCYSAEEAARCMENFCS